MALHAHPVFVLEYGAALSRQKLVSISVQQYPSVLLTAAALPNSPQRPSTLYMTPTDGPVQSMSWIQFNVNCGDSTRQLSRQLRNTPYLTFVGRSCSNPFMHSGQRPQDSSPQLALANMSVGKLLQCLNRCILLPRAVQSYPFLDCL